MNTLSILLIALCALFATSEAHLRATIGNYSLSVGYAVEPAWNLQPNGVSLTVSTPANISTAGLNFSTTVFAGGKSRVMNMAGVYGQAGAYIARFLPSVAGTYTFAFDALIPAVAENAETPIHFNVTCGVTYSTGGIVGAFNCVEDLAGYMFPEVVPDARVLAAGIQNATQIAEQAASAARNATALAERALQEHNTGSESGIMLAFSLMIVVASFVF
eukprot:TRINITY_DN21482_c0_g1_i1.p1 TRINITY_DN21482_c0_g1~~TRINITY_DN21482_c0_g1_i1.p1  ORF type:complete len:217 (-),score=59.47 TRINITY_DN21482_c0_g1_i1:174-824(-)